MKTIEFDFSRDLKGGMPKTGKQASYNKSNSSLLHQMHQTPVPLEIRSKGQEKKLFPAAKKGVSMKLSANQSSILADKSRYDNRKAMPSEFVNYRPKVQTQRNSGNKAVEKARAANFESNIF